MTASFPDHFSSVAANYARYRPTYPAQLFDWIASVAPATDAAWDCGCGNGQATLPLAERFDRVFATDPSAQQIAEAPRHPRITWSVAPAEASGLHDASVDAVTVAQALHWFDLAKFWNEVRRVVRPGGLVATWMYGVPFSDDADTTRVLRQFHDEGIGAYWPLERGYITNRYDQIDFPFGRIEAPHFELAADWTLEQLTGYLRTWSAVRRYIQANGGDPVSSVEAALRPGWGTTRIVRWPVTLVAGRVYR